jgi:hypothetical protein
MTRSLESSPTSASVNQVLLVCTPAVLFLRSSILGPPSQHDRLIIEELVDCALAAAADLTSDSKAI